MFPEVPQMTQPENKKVKIFQFGVLHTTGGNSDQTLQRFSHLLLSLS